MAAMATTTVNGRRKAAWISHMGNFSPLPLPKCILHQLEAAGYLTAQSRLVAGKRRKNYRITGAGRKLLRDARGKLRELVSELLDRV